MDLKLNPSLSRFLQSRGYTYWLAKGNSASSDGGAPVVTVIPIHKIDSIELPPGYAYFKITDDFSMIAPDYTGKIVVRLSKEESLKYKEFLISQVPAN
jgi:hypothetical protein